MEIGSLPLSKKKRKGRRELWGGCEAALSKVCKKKGTGYIESRRPLVEEESEAKIERGRKEGFHFCSRVTCNEESRRYQGAREIKEEVRGSLTQKLWRGIGLEDGSEAESGDLRSPSAIRRRDIHKKRHRQREEDTESGKEKKQGKRTKKEIGKVTEVTQSRDFQSRSLR